MPRYSNTPDRDERGRFISDDDRRSSRSNYDDDRRSSSSRYDDDDRGSSRSRSQGGWFGDREGHSQAAQRGWDRRQEEDDRGSSSRARSSRYDDDRRSSSSRYDDDDRGYSRDHGQGGWFGDREGHSQAAQRGWDRRHEEDDRGSSSRARSSRYDDDRRSSSGRYADDDRGYARDHGQGGWFGDPEGHSEAAQRGWDHRRDEDDNRRSYSRGRR